MRACCFTGHREIIESHREKLMDLLARGIEYVYNEGVRDFYNGGALGFDTLAAQAVLSFRISHPDVKLHMILPCQNQTRNWSAREIEMYEHILSVADTLEYVADEYYDGCMRVRNQRLVDLSDMIIAYVYRGGSGSSQTFRMAERAGLKTFNLYPSCTK